MIAFEHIIDAPMLADIEKLDIRKAFRLTDAIVTNILIHSVPVAGEKSAWPYESSLIWRQDD